MSRGRYERPTRQDIFDYNEGAGWEAFVEHCQREGLDHEDKDTQDAYADEELARWDEWVEGVAEERKAMREGW